jgi:hypothetical protein
VLLSALLLTLPLSALPLLAPPLLASDKPPSGQTATLIREAPIYISANAETQRLDRISPGRELMIAERSGKWLRVFANTDVEQNRASDAPVFDTESSTPPISGWIEDAGVISAATPNGDAILFGAAASAELAASEPHAPRGSAQAARLLYTRTAQIFPQSSRTPEAAWRAADIRWQLEKADVFSRPSAQEKESYLRQQIADDEMHKIEKKYPHTRSAATGRDRPSARRRSRRCSRNMRTSIRTRPRRRRRCSMPRTGKAQRATSTPAAVTIRKQVRPISTPAPSRANFRAAIRRAITLPAPPL